jgi:sec-independent protein translocase protein TatA
MMPGPTQLLIIALIILLLFGATRLSEIGKGLGEGIRNFKKGIQDEDDKVAADDSDDKQLPPKKKTALEAEGEEAKEEKA